MTYLRKRGEITKIEFDKKCYKSENLRQTTDEHVLAIFQKEIYSLYCRCTQICKRVKKFLLIPREIFGVTKCAIT